MQPWYLMGLLAAGALHAMHASAAEFEVGEHALGDRLDAVANDERYECAGESACFLMLSCRLKQPQAERLHGHALEGFTLHYAGERVAAIEAQLPSEAFAALRDARLRDSGEPELSQPDLLQWRRGSRVLRLEHAAGHTRLIVSQQSFLGELIEGR